MMEFSPPAPLASDHDKSFLYYVLRYMPDLVRGEWVNIGLLVFDPRTNQRQFRLIEDEAEFSRVRRLHPQTDERVLRSLQVELESRFEGARLAAGSVDDWEQILFKWDATLSNVLQLSRPAGSLGTDLESEADRLYADRVTVPRTARRTGALHSRAELRGYCSDVFRLAQLWNRLEKRVRASEFTFPGDPMRIDYGYRRNGTRGFVQTLSVSRSPGDAKLLAYTAKRIHDQSHFASEFTAVTDVALSSDNDRHRFVRRTLQDAGIVAVPREGFAVWVAKLRPMLLQ
jgi:hypothetical protein